MKNDVIRRARSEDLDFVFERVLEAGQGLIERFYGLGSRELAYRVMKSLWTGKPNRLHYNNCHIIEADNEPLGCIVAYSVGYDRYAGLGVYRIFKAGGTSFFWKYLKQIRELITALSMPEGKRGEYNIFAVATTMNARGQGIGTKLIEHAMAIARKENREKVSLVVTKGNEGAIKLYKRLGFSVDHTKKAEHALVYRLISDVTQ